MIQKWKICPPSLPLDLFLPLAEHRRDAGLCPRLSLELAAGAGRFHHQPHLIASPDPRPQPGCHHLPGRGPAAQRPAQPGLAPHLPRPRCRLEAQQSAGLAAFVWRTGGDCRHGPDLEEVEGVAALEISIPVEADAVLARSLLQAARGELPLIACLPLQLARTPWLPTLASSGARCDPPGFAGRSDRFDPRPAGGPGLLPLVMDALQAALACGLPVIAGGGVFTVEDGEGLLKAGALAVVVDSALWR